MFALERLGFPVWFVPTVQLSWHPGHGPSTRLATTQAAFDGFVDDLAGAPWLSEVGAVFSGYLGAAEQAGAVARLVSAVKARKPAALYLCDPVIGDGGGLFLPEAVAIAVRDQLLPAADIATPNRHELGWLTGSAPRDNAGLVAAARSLGVGEVAVTSAFADTGEIGNLAVAGGVHLASHLLLARAPHGAGDLLAALYLGARLVALSPEAALERAVRAVYGLLKLAEATGADELPLAAGQHLFAAAPERIAVSEIGKG